MAITSGCKAALEVRPRALVHRELVEERRTQLDELSESRPSSTSGVDMASSAAAAAGKRPWMVRLTNWSATLAFVWPSSRARLASTHDIELAGGSSSAVQRTAAGAPAIGRA